MDYLTLAKQNQILKVRVGSHLFGTNTPESDLDYEGIFMPSKQLVFGFGLCREVDLSRVCKNEASRNTKDAIDYKVREYRDFCRLALQNNPNILNMLFANDENVIFQNEFGKRLREKKYLFPHLGCLERFVGYGHSQLKKMTIRPENYTKLKIAERILLKQDPKEVILSFVEKHKNLVHFKDLGPGKHIQIGDIHIERGVKISKVLSVIRGRLDRASHRAVQWEEYGYDRKFASNLIQILLEGLELIETGGLSFPLKNTDLILGIKQGNYSKEDIIKMAEDIEADIDYAKDSSPLPKERRYKEVENFAISEIQKWINK